MLCMHIKINYTFKKAFIFQISGQESPSTQFNKYLSVSTCLYFVFHISEWQHHSAFSLFPGDDSFLLCIFSIFFLVCPKKGLTSFNNDKIPPIKRPRVSGKIFTPVKLHSSGGGVEILK